MTDVTDRPKVIDAETARRMALNEQVNPRKTILGEATQTLNPIDRKPYVGDPSLWPVDDQAFLRLGLASEIGYLPEYINSKNKSKYAEPKSAHYTFNPSLFPPAAKPQTTGFLDYQLALARMDVRDGKMHRRDYLKTERDIKEIVRRLNEADIPLRTITGAEGLDAALVQIKNEEESAQRNRFFRTLILLSQNDSNILIHKSKIEPCGLYAKTKEYQDTLRRKKYDYPKFKEQN